MLYLFFIYFDHMFSSPVHSSYSIFYAVLVSPQESVSKQAHHPVFIKTVRNFPISEINITVQPILAAS